MNKQQITDIAIEMVNEGGLINLSRSALCERAGIPDGSFPHVVGCTFSEFIKELKTAANVAENIVRDVVKSRANPELRKDQILTAAVELAKTKGYHKITRDAVAQSANVSAGLVSRYFNTMNHLRRSIMGVALNKEIPEIIAQGLANNDPRARKAPKDLKRQALDLIANY